MEIKVINNSNNPLPKYANEPINGLVQDSGMDVYADFSKLNEKFMYGINPTYREDGSIKSVTLHSLSRILIPTGIHTAIPEGYEIQVRDRSGNALKKGLIVANGVGTIDAKFTQIKIYNF